MGYAHGISTGTPLGRDDLRGQDESAAQRLRALGFTVRHLPYLNWKREEIILACEMVEANGWKSLWASDERVYALSRLLQNPGFYPLDQRYPDFRNPAGVSRKTHNIASVHPAYRGTPSHGSRLDREVVEDFLRDPARMHAEADRIRKLLTDGSRLPDLDIDDGGTGEGGLALRIHLQRERNPNARRRKIEDAKRRGLPIACEVCAFDFGHVYGARGLDYIECHHRTPLHVTGETQTKPSDLVLLCSNCHRMIHRTEHWLTVEELENIVAEQRRLLAGGAAAEPGT